MKRLKFDSIQFFNVFRNKFGRFNFRDVNTNHQIAIFNSTPTFLAIQNVYCIIAWLYFGWWSLADWVKSVRESSKDVKIVPRVIFEGWSINDYNMLFASRNKALDVAKTIKHALLVSTCLLHVCIYASHIYVSMVYSGKVENLVQN